MARPTRKKTTPLARALGRALRKRKWSVYDAARQIPGVNAQQLKNMLGHPGATRPTKPGHVRADTMLAVIAHLHPDVNLKDFDDTTELVSYPNPPRR